MEKTFEEITIVSGTTQAKIAPERGGLLTSFSVDNTEIFYLDRETFNDVIKNVRGGIPLLFPNAGPLKGGLYNLPQHGFVRKMPWKVTAQNRNSITLQLLSNAERLRPERECAHVAVPGAQRLFLPIVDTATRTLPD